MANAERLPPIAAEKMTKEQRLAAEEFKAGRGYDLIGPFAVMNPFLQQLPRLSLDDMPMSNYLIRKAHRPGQLSTLEATCAALAQLEGNAEKYEPLLKAFDGFVAQRLAFVSR